MAKPDSWMPLYWGDYHAATGHLSALEHGAYLMLIGHYWNTRKPLPVNDDALARIAKCTAREWASIKATILEFFDTSDPACMRHGRIDRELTRAVAVYERRRQAAEDTNAKRSGKRDGDRDGDRDAKATPTETESGTQLQPQPHSSNEEAKILLADFEAWYAAYPRKVAKAAALKAYRSARKRASREDLLAGIAAYRKTKADYADWAHPATWLNGDRWLDQPNTVAVAASDLMPIDASLQPYLPKLRQEFDVPTINSWFASTKLVERDDWLTLVAPTKFAADHINRTFQSKLRVVFGEQFQVGHGRPTH